MPNSKGDTPSLANPDFFAGPSQLGTTFPSQQYSYQRYISQQNPRNSVSGTLPFPLLTIPNNVLKTFIHVV
jgi:hypothetical protein